MDGFDLFRYLPLAFVAFGLFYAANGVWALVAGRRFEQAADRVEGTVVDVRNRVVHRSSSGTGRPAASIVPAWPRRWPRSAAACRSWI